MRNEDFLLKTFGLYQLKGYFCITNTVGIAQLVRALDCGSRGRRFEPDYLPKKLLRNEELFLLLIKCLSSETLKNYRRF